MFIYPTQPVFLRCVRFSSSVNHITNANRFSETHCLTLHIWRDILHHYADFFFACVLHCVAPWYFWSWIFQGGAQSACEPRVYACALCTHLLHLLGTIRGLHSSSAIHFALGPNNSFIALPDSSISSILCSISLASQLQFLMSTPQTWKKRTVVDTPTSLFRATCYAIFCMKFVYMRACSNAIYTWECTPNMCVGFTSLFFWGNKWGKFSDRPTTAVAVWGFEKKTPVLPYR